MNFNELFIDIEQLPKPLTKEELFEYFEQSKLGDKKAREEIIKHNIRLVISEVVRKFSNTPYDLDDLVSIGLIGLIKSVETFDTNRNCQFTTYSTRCIDNEILMFMRKNRKYISDIGLEQPIFVDKDGTELKIEDKINDNDSDFVQEYEDKETYEIIRRIVNKLPNKEKNIIEKYFGFTDNSPMKQEEIAFELGISQSCVSRLIKRTLQDISIQLRILGIIEVSSFEIDLDNNYGINQMEQIAKLVSSGFTIDDVCTNIGLSNKQKYIASLILAKEYYAIENYEMGDYFLNEVENTNNKTKFVNSLCEEVRHNRQLYKNMYEKGKKPLILTSKPKK